MTHPSSSTAKPQDHHRDGGNDGEHHDADRAVTALTRTSVLDDARLGRDIGWRWRWGRLSDHRNVLL
jgi:hypothetical protein